MARWSGTEKEQDPPPRLHPRVVEGRVQGHRPEPLRTSARNPWGKKVLDLSARAAQRGTRRGRSGALRGVRRADRESREQTRNGSERGEAEPRTPPPPDSRRPKADASRTLSRETLLLLAGLFFLPRERLRVRAATETVGNVGV